MAPRAAPRAAWCLLGLVLGWCPSARAITSTSTSDITSDPSCVTVQVAAASTARSNSDCPAVLVAVTLTASTEDCASGLEMLMVIEEYPRDVRTFGGESTTSLTDKSITWKAPSLSVGTSLSVEFRIDLCGYCDKYNNGRFNPIDSFQYDDNEGNEPNDRKMGYKLKLDCVGIEGDPVDTIVATPEPEPTPSPGATAVPSSPAAEAGATTAPAMTPAPAKTPGPAATQAPAGASSAPVMAMTQAPAVTVTQTPAVTVTQAPAVTVTQAPAVTVTQAPAVTVTQAPAVTVTQAPAMTMTQAPAVTVTQAPAVTVTQAPAMTMTQAPAVTVTQAPAMTMTQAPAIEITQAPAMEGEGASLPPATSSASSTGVESSQAEEVEEVSAESSEEERGSSDDDDESSDNDSSSDDDSDGSGSSDSSASTVAPTIAGTQGSSRAVFFTEAPTASPTAAPTFLGGVSSQGVSLEIQSIFEARRRALATDTDVSDPPLERRALSVVFAEDADEYDEAMAGVCASMLGVGKESIISVSTDFGPNGPAEDAARRGLMTSSSSSEDGAATATQLTPITTCEVDLSGSGDTRAMSAAILVDRMMEPDNFVVMLEENRFGPVNAVVSSISFWQNECRDQTCPAGDGSYASVYPVNDGAENQRSVVGDDSSGDEQKIFWFVVLAAGLLMAAVFSWCCFCLCCAGSSKRQRKPKRSLEEKYSVKSPPKGGAVATVVSPPRPRRQRSAAPPSPTNGTPPSGSSLPGPSPTTPPQPRPNSQPSGRRRAPVPRLSSSPAGISAAGSGGGGNAAGMAEPPSPGEADWRNKFGLGPLRDYAFRSAPVSPRRTPSSNSARSASVSSAGDPFCATYRDNVVAAADGKLGEKLRLPPLADDASTAMESQSTWQMTDDMNASVQHTNDPVVRSSLGKAGMVIANALSSPRRELNRLKEALNRPSRSQSCTSTSPTVTASSADPSSAPGFGGSEGGFSPQITLGSGSHFNSNSHYNGGSSHFNTVSSPIYEIDLEADESGGPSAAAPGESEDRVATNPAAEASAAGAGGEDLDRAGDSSSHGAASSVGSTPSSHSRKSGRNMFAKVPGSTSRPRSGSSSHGTPTSPSARSAATDKSDTNPNAGGGGGTPFSVLERAAAAAEVKVGVHSPTGRAVQAFANASRNGGSGDAYDGSVEGSQLSVDEPPTMPPLPTNGGGGGGGDKSPEVTRAAAVAAAAATAIAMSKATSGTDEGGGKAGPPAPSPRGSGPHAAPFGGVLSGFGCMAPQISPRAGSRLPEIDDVDEDGDVDMDLGEDDDGDGDAQVVAGKEGAPAPGGSSAPLPRPPPYPEKSPERRERVGAGAGVGDRSGDGDGAASAPGVALEAAAALSRSRTIAPDLTPIAELAENDAFSDSETESEVSSLASSVSSARSGRRRAPRDPAALLAAAMEKAGQVAAIPPPSAGSPGQLGRPLSAVQEVPMEPVPLPGLFNPEFELNGPSTPRRGVGGGFQSGGSITTPSPPPPATQAPLTPRASAETAAEAPIPIPSPAQRPEGQPSPSAEGGAENVRLAGAGAGAGAGVYAYLHGEPSPARSRQEAEDEENEHKLWEQATDKQQKAGVVEGGGAPKLDSPSAAPLAGSLERAATPSASVPAAPGVQTAVAKAEAPKPPGFSLMGALASFLGRKDTEVAPPVVAAAEEAEEETEEAEATVTINIPPESGSAPDFTESPESHTLELWPDAIVEKPSKSSLDDGFVDAPVEEVVAKPPRSSLDEGFVDAEAAMAMPMEEEEEGEGEESEAGAFKLPERVSSADLPALVLPADETDDFSKNEKRVFSRSTMNLQSPGPDSPKAPDPDVAPMPDLPEPPSPTHSAVGAVKTPSTITNPCRISDASPMYDRAAIARAMSQAAEEADLDGESDIVMPSGAWPSERRQNSYTGSNSVISDMTSSSSGSGNSAHGSTSTSSSGGSGSIFSSSSGGSGNGSGSGGHYSSSDASDGTS